jgi:tetratricopeptide (TPR) repeat protein
MVKRSNLCKQGVALACLIAVVISLSLIDEAFAKSEQDIKETATITDHRPYAKDAITHYNSAIDLHEHGFLSQAVTEYKAAIEADNRMDEAYSNLGVIYTAQHSYDKALECFQKAFLLKPNRATTLNGLGSALYGLGRVDEAIAKWRRAIEIDPNFQSAYFNLAKALKETGHIDEAQRVLNAEPKNWRDCLDGSWLIVHR